MAEFHFRSDNEDVRDIIEHLFDDFEGEVTVFDAGHVVRVEVQNHPYVIDFKGSTARLHDPNDEDDDFDFEFEDVFDWESNEDFCVQVADLFEL